MKIYPIVKSNTKLIIENGFLNNLINYAIEHMEITVKFVDVNKTPDIQKNNNLLMLRQLYSHNNRTIEQTLQM